MVPRNTTAVGLEFLNSGELRQSCFFFWTVFFLLTSPILLVSIPCVCLFTYVLCIRMYQVVDCMYVEHASIAFVTCFLGRVFCVAPGKIG